MKVKIYFSSGQNMPQPDIRLTSLVRRAVMTALKCENFPRDCEVSVSFVDNKRIRELNLKYRNKDVETDVLSFPMTDLIPGSTSLGFSREPLLLGDIVLSLEKVKEQAEEFGHGFDREAAFLCVHSVLHLLGYDHELSDREDADMRERQRKIMKHIRV